MSAHRDPRRRSFFDTPSSRGSAKGETEQSDSDDENFPVPRRKKRTRRVSTGANMTFTTDDGFQYRRRQTLINPKVLNNADGKIDSSPRVDIKSGSSKAEQTEAEKRRNSTSALNNSAEKTDPKKQMVRESSAAFGKRLSDPSKFKKIPKKSVEHPIMKSSAEYPAYPDTSEWSPVMPESDQKSAEIKLLHFLKQMVSFEICQASCVYLKDEHKFILDRIESVCKSFLAKADEAVFKILEESGPLIEPTALPNPANAVLRQKQQMWNEVIAATQAELLSWDELKNRPPVPASDLKNPDIDVQEYLRSQNLSHLLEHIEYHEPIVKGFLSISVKSDNIYKAAQASSQVLAEATNTQEQIARWVTQRSLKLMQKVADPQTALLNVISSKIT